jgi:hypothetical protein
MKPIDLDDLIYFGCGGALVIVGILEFAYPSKFGSPFAELVIGIGALAIGLHRRRRQA